jgi:L-seryl-tRNA(Ser) seleniumtransferase
LAGLRAIKAFDPELIRKARRMAEDMIGPFNESAQGHAYLAGAGVALSGDRLLEMAMQKNGKTSAIVPIEAVAFASMRLLESYGGVTIPAIGMPGASCTYRLMLYPDGMRLGVPTLLEASNAVFEELADVIDKPELVHKVLLG